MDCNLTILPDDIIGNVLKGKPSEELLKKIKALLRMQASLSTLHYKRAVAVSATPTTEPFPANLPVVYPRNP